MGFPYHAFAKGLSMRVLVRIVRFIETISEWTGKSFSFFIFILAAIVCYEIVARYVFSRPTLWCHELSAMIFGTFAVIGGAYTLKSGGHVSMDLLLLNLPVRARAAVEILASFAAFAFLSVLLWKGGETALNSVKTLEHASTLWAPPIWPFKLMLPLGAFLFLLQLFAKLIRDVLTLISGQEEI